MQRGLGDRRLARWLATTSVAAIVAGTQLPARAASCNASYTSVTITGCTNAGTLSSLTFTNATSNGSLSNTGTISPGGISVINSTISGGITDSGTIAPTNGSFGISIDNASLVAGINVNAPTYQGGISNGGMISNGMHLGAPGSYGHINSTLFSGDVINSGTISGTLAVRTTLSFAGSITNAGSIAGGNAGIGVAMLLPGPDTRFQGNIVNLAGATISDPNQVGIYADSADIYGGITNAGVITAGGLGIYVVESVSFGNASTGGGITNSGSITASGAANAWLANTGIQVGLATSAGLDGISSFFGGITNSGTISADGGGINVMAAGTFTGGVSNAGGGSMVVGGAGISVGFNLGGGVYAVSRFSGGIGNAGLITAGSTGIVLNGVSTFLGGIGNSGTISAARNGIGIGAVGLLGSDSSGAGIANDGVISAAPNAGAADGASAVHNGIVVTTVSSFAGNIRNGGAIAAGNDGITVGTVSTFAGAIVSTGTIAAGATGIRIANVSTVTGGVSNAGTISAGFNGIAAVGFSTFAGGISNSGTISASTFSAIEVGNNGFASSTFLGGITNSGAVSAAAFDAVLVDMVSTFSGGISNSGTISAGGAGIRVGFTFGNSVFPVATFLDGITNSGTVVGHTGIRVIGGATFAGAIANTGTITGAGGTAIDVSQAPSAMTINQLAGTLTGAIKLSAFADQLNVSGGVLNGSIIGSGSADTVSFALGSGRYGGNPALAITGVHALNISSGTVVLDAAVNSASTVTVGSGGALVVGDAGSPGAMLTGSVDVAGMLSGRGTIAGAVTVAYGGTLAPGGSLGTLTVFGNVTFKSGSFYAVQVSGGTSSQTVVTGTSGTATINGGTVLVTLTPQATGLGAHAAQQYTIVNASGGVRGTFAGLTVNGSPGFTAPVSLSYDADDVFLNLGPSFTLLTLPVGAGVNQQNVGNGINNAILAGLALPPGFQNLGNLSGASLLNGLSQLSGELGASVSQGAFQAGGAFINLMLNPFVDARGGAAGVGPLGFAPERPPLPDAANAFASVVKAPNGPAPLAPAARFATWGAVYGGTDSVNGNAVSGSHDTSAQVFGMAGGLDYRLSANSLVGFALAGGGTNWSIDQSLGSGRSDMFQAGLYGSTRSGPTYLSAALAWSLHDVTTNRSVTLAGTDRLQANFRAGVLSERIEGGYRWATPWLGITPYAAVQAQSLFLPSYGESATSGSAQFALAYAARTQTTTRTETGVWLDKRLLLDQGAFATFYARAAWTHDINNAGAATALFQTLPTASFVVNGARPAADGALLSAGAQYRLASGWSLQAKFDGELSSTTSIYAGTGVIRKEW